MAVPNPTTTNAHDSVFINSIPLDENQHPVVKGYDFQNGVDYSELFKTYINTGYQATHLAQAINIVNEMIHYKTDIVDEENEPCKIFLGCK
jgi:deoxyhypusine synthase